MRRLVLSSLAACLCLACAEPKERNAPPVGSGGGGPYSGGPPSASTATASDTNDDGSSGDPTGGLTMGPTGGASTGASEYAVITGRFNDGGGGYALPIQCSVKFHRPGEINPTNGIETATTFSRPFIIDQFPESFTIMNTEIGDIVMPGDTGFISAECDVDGDNFFDDNAGGYFPSLPMTEVTVPASSIDIAVGPL